jgi:hypothetical protein
MVPEYGGYHRWHNLARVLLLDCLKLFDEHPVVLPYVWVRTLLDVTHLVDALNHRTIAQVKDEHIVHAACQVLTKTVVRVIFHENIIHTVFVLLFVFGRKVMNNFLNWQIIEDCFAIINIIYACCIVCIAVTSFIFKLSLIKFLILNIILGFINFVQCSYYARINYLLFFLGAKL